jgi:hypothetical protein
MNNNAFQRWCSRTKLSFDLIDHGIAHLIGIVNHEDRLQNEPGVGPDDYGFSIPQRARAEYLLRRGLVSPSTTQQSGCEYKLTAAGFHMARLCQIMGYRIKYRSALVASSSNGIAGLEGDTIVI